MGKDLHCSRDEMMIMYVLFCAVVLAAMTSSRLEHACTFRLEYALKAIATLACENPANQIQLGEGGACECKSCRALVVVGHFVPSINCSLCAYV